MTNLTPIFELLPAKDKLVFPEGELAEVSGGWAFGGSEMARSNIYNNQPNIVFGGDGSDGELNIASGTTTIDLAGAALTIKNYSNILITGTGILAFTNANANGSTVILRSQRGITITSTATRVIDLRSFGATAGTGGAGGGTGNTGQGGDGGNSAIGLGNRGGGGNGVGSSTGGTAGTDGKGSFTAGGGTNGATSEANKNVSAPRNLVTSGYNTLFGIRHKSIILVPGAGGGGGAGGANGAGGAGGRGGGCIYFECKGALRITGTIDVSGAAGSASAGTDGGGGGGGAGGNILIIYGVLTTDSGTYTISGGAGGASGGGGGNGGGGANGYSLVVKNTEFL